MIACLLDSWLERDAHLIVMSWRRLALVAPFPIDDIPERLALKIGAQIVAEEVDGAMTVLITVRRDMRRDQYPRIGPEP